MANRRKQCALVQAQPIGVEIAHLVAGSSNRARPWPGTHELASTPIEALGLERV